MPNVTTAQIRVMLVDDDSTARHGLKRAVNDDPKLTVVGEAATFAEAERVAGEVRPDVILLDLNLEEDEQSLSGIELIPKFREASPDSKVIVVTGVRDFEAHRSAIGHGAKGLVLKKHAIEQVARAIHQVYDGDVWFNRTLMWEVIEGMARAKAVKEADPEATKIASLTQRERQVVEKVGEGLKNKAIAARLFIAEVTVRHHLTEIYSKLGVSDRLELVIYAYIHSLAEIPKSLPGQPE